MATATMDDELFRALRDDAGMPESAAEKVARLIFRRDRRDDEFVTKTERKAEREVEREAARAVREAERKADRDAFAARDDVTVLQAKAENTDSAIERIDQTLLRMDERFERMDERFERIDATITEIKEAAARTDEKVNNLQWLTKVVVIPLSLLNLGALFGVIGLLIRLLMVQGP